MKKILLDTNFILTALKFNIHLFEEIDRIFNEEYQIFILSTSLKELEKLINTSRGELSSRAKLSLQILKQKKVKTLISKGKVDDTLVKKKDFIIATQDKELKKRIKNKILTIRQKSHLELI